MLLGGGEGRGDVRAVSYIYIPGLGTQVEKVKMNQAIAFGHH
jgi:hypothetical protein